MKQKTEMSNTQSASLSNEVIGALADAFGKDFLTIKRWVEKKDDRLTSDRAKQVFTNKQIQWCHDVNN